MLELQFSMRGTGASGASLNQKAVFVIVFNIVGKAKLIFL